MLLRPLHEGVDYEQASKDLLPWFGFFSLIVLAVGYALKKQEQSALDALFVKCETEMIKASPKGPWLKYQDDPLVCEHTELIGSTKMVGMQQENVQSCWKHGDYFFWSQLLAALLLGVFALPCAWYFLLRRVRELVKAITGKRKAIGHL